ncbi:hypothetical protein D1115_17890 [Vibrio alfacsensis]|uniref:Uncharacterized protein n=1 Tax=Vibrio alfacsensis TaxID=1074311 RepID=A0ABM6YY73_9VIBR|nr:hypothetical protein [Vibrio alfacsensis]AXY02858.1 hypothetical protein D1115_17890 [Vibrio alfacsensis]
MGVGVLFFSGFFLFLFDAENPSKTYSIISAQFYAASVILIFAHRNEAIRYITNAPFSLLICLLAFLSVFWSYSPTTAIVRSIALFGTFCFALSLVLVFTWEQLIKVIVYPLVFASIVAVFVGVFLPAIGVDDGSKVAEHYGLWQGTFGFKID